MLNEFADGAQGQRLVVEGVAGQHQANCKVRWTRYSPPGGQGASPAPASSPAEKPKDIKGVFVLEGKKVKFVPVETGITGESDIEITSGLQKDMEVITGPSRVLRTLKEGDTVQRQQNKPGDKAGAKK